MHIGVNGRRLEGQRFGVARYIEYMLKFWSRQLNQADRVTLFLRNPVDTTTIGLSDQFSVQVAPLPFSGVAWENLVLSRVARSVDVLFCPSYTAPLLPLRTPIVVATHSLNEAMPGTHSWVHNQTYSRWYRWSARRARRVLAPSEWTARALQKHYGVPSNRIDVVPLGVDLDTFRPVDDGELLRCTRRRYLGADVPYVLFVGKMSRRRNILSLLVAFARVKAKYDLPHKLLLFGPNHEGIPLAETIRELKMTNDVIQTDGRVASHSDLVPVYAAAEVFVHPTTCDATSLPVHEAFAVGLPVLTVRTAGIAEIAEGAAYLVDEATPDGIAAGLETLLLNPDLRSQVRCRGLERAKLCSWDGVAAQTLEVLRRAAA